MVYNTFTIKLVPARGGPSLAQRMARGGGQHQRPPGFWAGAEPQGSLQVYTVCRSTHTHLTHTARRACTCSDCPQDLWANETVEGVLAQFPGSIEAELNGPRQWCAVVSRSA